jgi:N-acetylneuraminate synthase
LVTVSKTVNIADHSIGNDHPCFIIAEAGVNHNGESDKAHQLVETAAKTGANAVKFQTFLAEKLATPDAPKAEYQKQTTGTTESQYEMLRQLELSPEMHRELMDHCQELGILFLSSPFDEDSADVLAKLDVAAYKVPSGEITNFPLLAHIARKNRPMIVSTGMAYMSEVEAAVRVIEDAGNTEIILLHCVSNYPASPEDINLRAMASMSAAFRVPVGYSDHTPGIEIPISAVALGARVIEKHLTLDRNLPGPDHRASLEPSEFGTLVQAIRSVESALGDGRKIPAASEINTTEIARKSLFASKDIPAGSALTSDLIAVKRPGTGLPPSMLQYVVGRAVRDTIPSGAPITLENLA